MNVFDIIVNTDDLENQSAAFLAKSVDPEGLRTIGISICLFNICDTFLRCFVLGVLTKPDTLQSGEHQSWFDVLEGHRHPLTHGYFVTKHPAIKGKGRRLDNTVARLEEDEFFENNDHWKTASRVIQERTGVVRLTTKLSILLNQLIERR